MSWYKNADKRSLHPPLNALKTKTGFYMHTHTYTHNFAMAEYIHCYGLGEYMIMATYRFTVIPIMSANASWQSSKDLLRAFISYQVSVRKEKPALQRMHNENDRSLSLKPPSFSSSCWAGRNYLSLLSEKANQSKCLMLNSGKPWESWGQFPALCAMLFTPV